MNNVPLLRPTPQPPEILVTTEPRARSSPQSPQYLSVSFICVPQFVQNIVTSRRHFSLYYTSQFII